MPHIIYNEDCLDRLEQMDVESVDCIITDPPYELNFMSKGWDNAGVSFRVDTWTKCLRVLKPGGYLLAFGGSRTFHRIACAIEDAGFELRDTIMWLYGSGFPKSLNIGKKTGLEEWTGWGSCLKPSFEPIIVARKPFKGSLVNNVLKYGVGGLNIDECRVPLQDKETIAKNIDYTDQRQAEGWGTRRCITEPSDEGRFPANTILDSQEEEEWRRYFYCAKVSKRDRDEGLTMRHNTHPTVKPTSLMQYLVRLVAPKGATILDPFMGSGSTGKAVVYENKERGAGYEFIGIEKDPEYCKIAATRIEYAKKKTEFYKGKGGK